MDGKTADVAHCSKSHTLTKSIDLILDIESFEKCVFIKGLFQSDQLKQHMVIIGIYQLLSNSAIYEYRCLENIKKLYTSAGKFDDQHQYKSIIEAEMVSNPDRFTDNGTLSPGPSVTVINPSARKSLRIFTEVLDFKKNTYVFRVGAAKSKSKATRAGSVLWSSIPKRKVHTKINERVKKSLYNWI